MAIAGTEGEPRSGRTVMMTAGAVVAILIVVVGFAYILNKDSQRNGKLTLFYGDKKFAEMEIKDGNVGIEKLLGDLFTDEGREKTFRLLVQPRQYYQLQDPALVALGIVNLKYEEPNAKKLRELYYEGKGPFVPQEFEARVEFATDNRVSSGHAAICPKHEMFQKELFVLGPEGRGAAVLRADLQGRCDADRRGEAVAPLLQIGFTDARRIFGCTKLLKEEKVYAVEKRFQTPDVVADPRCK